jgi:hypothetical protein
MLRPRGRRRLGRLFLRHAHGPEGNKIAVSAEGVRCVLDPVLAVDLRSQFVEGNELAGNDLRVPDHLGVNADEAFRELAHPPFRHLLGSCDVGGRVVARDRQLCAAAVLSGALADHPRAFGGSDDLPLRLRVPAVHRHLADLGVRADAHLQLSQAIARTDGQLASLGRRTNDQLLSLDA